MPMRSAVFSLFFFVSLSSFALETDNYLSWDKELSDSSSHINRYLSDSINSSLSVIPDHRNKTCEEITELIAKEFESHLVHDNPVENWLFQVLTSQEMFPEGLHYVEESIYRDPYRFYIPWFGLAPTIQVNGFYFGTDKLSHFASTGMIYFRIYKDEMRKGKISADATRKAIDWGIRDEKTVHGYWASGVFSYADLEANYQGLKFYKDFCKKDGSFLSQKNDGEWKLVRTPDIAEYVSGFWDETFELSYRLPENWKKVSGVIREKYCVLSATDGVKKRFQYYRQSSVPGFSKEYIRQQKDLPDPSELQSISSLCQKME